MKQYEKTFLPREHLAAASLQKALAASMKQD